MFLTDIIAPGATAATDASNILMQILGQIRGGLMNIIYANNDPDVVAMNVHIINNIL